MHGQSISLSHKCIICTAPLAANTTSSGILYAKCLDTGVLILNGGGVKKCSAMTRAE